MAMLKTITGHTGLARSRRYLEKGSARKYVEGVKRERMLGEDFVNISPRNQPLWDLHMDRTRRRCGNDEPWGGKPAATYRHFIISPDPKDGVSLEQLRRLSVLWAKANFGEGGRFGSYQVKITYHDDNAGGIPHAHVIVNNTDLSPEHLGRRLHLTKRETRGLSKDLQRLCERMGLSRIDRPEASEAVVEDAPVTASRGAVPSRQRVYRPRTEMAARARGVRLWKDDLRDWSALAAASSKTTSEYIAVLRMYGVVAEVKNGDVLYRHPSSDSRKCYGRRLGRDFTPRGVRDAQERAWFKGALGDRHVIDARFISAAEAAGLSMREIAVCVNVICGGRTDEVELRLAVHEARRVARAGGECALDELERLETALAVAEKTGLLEDSGLVGRDASLPKWIEVKAARGERIPASAWAALTMGQREIAAEIRALSAARRAEEAPLAERRAEESFASAGAEVVAKIKRGERLDAAEYARLDERQRSELDAIREMRGDSRSLGRSDVLAGRTEAACEGLPEWLKKKIAAGDRLDPAVYKMLDAAQREVLVDNQKAARRDARAAGRRAAGESPARRGAGASHVERGLHR